MRIICLFILLTGLCACTQESLSAHSDTPFVPDSSVTEESSAAYDYKNYKIKNKVNEFLEFDADVFIPNQKEFGLYNTSPLLFNADEVKKAFMGNTEVNIEQITPNNINFSTTNTGNFANISDNNFDYSKGSLYKELIKINLNNRYWNNNASYLNRSLSFMTCEQAVELLNNRLSLFTSLKTDSAIADIYSFNTPDLNDINNSAIIVFQEKLKTTQEQKLKDRIQSELQQRTAYKAELENNKNKQCYYIIAKLTYNNVPIYNNSVNFDSLPSSVDESSTLSPPYFVGIVSSDGIEALILNNNIQIKEPLKTYEYQSFVSLEQVIKLFEEKYSKVAAKTSVKSISMCYLFKPEDFTREKRNSYVLAPVWAFEGRRANEQTDWNGPFLPREQFTAFFDAVTGEEIV